MPLLPSAHDLPDRLHGGEVPPGGPVEVPGGRALPGSGPLRSCSGWAER